VGTGRVYSDGFKASKPLDAGSVVLADSVSLRGQAMPCKSCGSENLQKFRGEIAVHFLGLKCMDMPIVWVFPELVVCLDCGNAQFIVPEAELQTLRKGTLHEQGDIDVS